MVLLLAGCVKRYESLAEAEADGAVLGERITVDGADVSNMGVTEARAAIERAQKSAMERMSLTVTAGGDSVSIPVSELPVTYDTDGAIFAALGEKCRHADDLPTRAFNSNAAMDAEGLRAVLAGYVKALEREAVNAAVSYDGGKFVYTEDEPGRSVDVMELAGRVQAQSNAPDGVFEAVTTQIPPEYTLNMAKEDTRLISEFSTSFAGSTYSKKNRVFNIQKAAELLNGTSVAAGESMDMNHVLGDRNERNGWRTATAIRDGAYTQEYGGGVCQVSTTLYNAVLMADLEVQERHHHSWPLGYVGVGMDATISTGGPNFIFKNTTEAPIYIGAFADTEDKTITVRIYGRKSFDGSIEITSKKVGTLDAAGYETELDASLPYGTREEARKARRGCMSETYKNYYDADGNFIRSELVTKDKYRSIKGLMRLSPDIYYGAEAAAIAPAG